MRVLLVFNELMASGAEAMVFSAGRYNGERGIRAEILSTGEEVGPYAIDLEEAGFTIHHIPYRKHLSFYLDLHRLLKRGSFDVIHIFSERSFFFYALVARLNDIRAIRTVCAIFPFSGLLALRQRLFRTLFRMIGGKMAAISPSVLENEQRRFSNPTRIVPNWYNNFRFSPPSAEERAKARASFGLTDSQVAVVSVGNCHEVKNHTELLKALALLKGELNYIYLHIGKEEPGEPERLFAQDLGIADSVRFVGYTRDILPALHACDVFVMPSIREGFGVAAVEALGTGVPSVFARVAGLRDFEGIPSIHYADKATAELFVPAIRAAASLNEDERRDAGKKAHEAVNERYGVCTGLQIYAEMYEAQAGGQQ